MKIKDFIKKGYEILPILNEVKTSLPDKFKFVPHSKRPLSTTTVETDLGLSDERVERAWNLVRLSKLSVNSHLIFSLGSKGCKGSTTNIVIIHDTNVQYEVDRLVKRMLDVCADED